MTKKEKGFTLIELLVVVAIIGTLSSLVLVAMGEARKRARDAVRQSDMRQVLSAQQMYYADNEAYLATTTSSAGTHEIPGYLRILHDPLYESTWDDYTWIKNDEALDCTNDDYDAASAQWFCVYAKLERDPAGVDCETDDAYMAASHKGTLVVCSSSAPTTSSSCTCIIAE